jgi:hypothetical protein
VDLDSVADELYGLSVAEFTRSRQLRAKQAKDQGRPELAAAINKLRRPTLSAWAANQLVRQRPETIGELLDLGTTLRGAHRELAADKIRQLDQERKRLLVELSRTSRELARTAGSPLGEPAVRELESTLEAAIADPDAAAALRAGRLVKAMHYSGFGMAGTPSSGSEPATSRRPRRSKVSASEADAKSAITEAKRAARGAQRQLRAAETKLDKGQLARVAAEARVAALRRAEESAQREVDAARTKASAAAEALRIAEEAT